MGLDVNWKNSGVAVRDLSFEQLETLLTPLINKYAYSGGESRYAKGGIRGFDVDDFAQEVRLVIWNCQRSYNPESKQGHEGKASSFLNFVITSIENKFGKLRSASDKFYKPVTQLECEACQTRIPVQGFAKCVCGNRRWTPIRSEGIVSVDELLVQPTEDPDFGSASELLKELPAELLSAARSLLIGSDTTTDRKALRSFGKRDQLPPELSYQRSIRKGVMS